jgi:hypothetical protein
MAKPPEAEPDGTSHIEHFLHLLEQLERTVEHDLVEWNAESALAAQRRVDRLAAMLRRIAAGLRHH